MSNSNFKIFLALFLSITIIFFINQFSQNPLVFVKKLENLPKNILAASKNIKLPTIDFSSFLSFNKFSTLSDNFQNYQDSSFNLPTSKFTPPTPTLEIINNQQIDQQNPSISDNLSNQISQNPPTQPPRLTYTQKPTKPPKPSSTPKPPAITSDERPGETMEAIFQEVSKRMCIPVALLHAFQTQESGPYFPYNSSPSIIKIYNTYGWWINGKGDPCFGLGYFTQSGLVPEDSIKAGQICRNPVQPNAYDQKIMGIFQISESEQNSAYKYLKDIFPKNYDRRVLFDNAMIFALITKNRLGNPPKNCDDWPADAIKTAAQKHYGSCGDNYCANILKYYKQYK